MSNTFVLPFDPTAQSNAHRILNEKHTGFVPGKLSLIYPYFGGFYDGTVTCSILSRNGTVLPDNISISPMEMLSEESTLSGKKVYRCMSVDLSLHMDIDALLITYQAPGGYGKLNRETTSSVETDNRSFNFNQFKNTPTSFIPNTHSEDAYLSIGYKKLIDKINQIKESYERSLDIHFDKHEIALSQIVDVFNQKYHQLFNEIAVSADTDENLWYISTPEESIYRQRMGYASLVRSYIQRISVSIGKFIDLYYKHYRDTPPDNGLINYFSNLRSAYILKEQSLRCQPSNSTMLSLLQNKVNYTTLTWQPIQYTFAPNTVQIPQLKEHLDFVRGKGQWLIKPIICPFTKQNDLLFTVDTSGAYQTLNHLVSDSLVATLRVTQNDYETYGILKNSNTLTFNDEPMVSVHQNNNPLNLYTTRVGKLQSNILIPSLPGYRHSSVDHSWSFFTVIRQHTQKSLVVLAYINHETLLISDVSNGISIGLYDTTKKGYIAVGANIKPQQNKDFVLGASYDHTLRDICFYVGDSSLSPREKCSYSYEHLGYYDEMSLSYKTIDVKKQLGPIGITSSKNVMLLVPKSYFINANVLINLADKMPEHIEFKHISFFGQSVSVSDFMMMHKKFLRMHYLCSGNTNPMVPVAYRDSKLI